MPIKLFFIILLLLPNIPLWAMEAETEVSSAQILMQKGEACLKDSNWMEALDYFEKLIPLYKQHPEIDPGLFAKGFCSAGNTCQVKERYIQALDFYILGLQASERARDDGVYNRCLGNIGNIYLAFNDYDTALLYYNKGYDRCVTAKDFDRQVTFLTNMISTYCYMHQPDKAKEYFQKLMKLPMKDMKMQTFHNLYNQAIIAQAEKNYAGAVYFHRQALEYADRNVLDKRFVVAAYRELSNTYREKGELAQAIDCLKKGEEVAGRYGYTLQKIECYKLLSELYSLKQDSSLASHYRILYVSFTDSVNQQEYNKVKNKLVKYEEQQNSSIIGKLSGQINMQRWIIVFVTICFFIVLILIIFIFRQNKKLQRAYHTLFNRNSELIDSDEMYRQMQQKYRMLAEQFKKYREDCPPSVPATQAKEVEEESVDKKLPLALSSELTEKLLEDVLKVMEDETYIFDPDFGLNQLAKLVNSNTKYVSWVINETYNKNFRTFLNEYRIREASKRLLNAEKYGSFTIQAIAEGIGFKSVANFVVAFKKNVGITPSLYQKMARKEIADEEEEEG